MQTLVFAFGLLVCALPAQGADCAPSPSDSTADPSACERDQRRTEVRSVATRRLAALRRAIAGVAGQQREGDGEFAVARTGRPAPWCEAVLNDVLALRNIEVVDDADVRGPRWIESTNADGQRSLIAGPVLDPAFLERRVGGRDVVQGYVTLRWRADSVIMLRVVAACAETDSQTLGCHHSHRHAAAFVYDAEMPFACAATFYERPQLTNWKDVLTPLRLDLAASSGK